MFEISIIFLICTISGIFTGLLGIGGGLIIVPSFLFILPLFNITSLSIHQIVGISTTCVFLNSATSVFYRRKEQFLDRNLLIKLALFIIIGTVSGAYLTSFLPKNVILSVYILVALMSLYLFKKTLFFDAINSKYSPLLYLIFSFIGALSSIIGIGGAVFFVTALKCFVNPDTKKLLPSLTVLVCVHAAFAFFSKLALGEVVAIIIPFALLASIIGSKIGIKISQKLPTNTINILFQIVLSFGILVIAFEMLR